MTQSNWCLGYLLPSYLNSGSQTVCFTPLSVLHEFQCCHTFVSSTYTSNSLPIDHFLPWHVCFLALSLAFPPLVLSLIQPSIILFLFHLHFVIYLLFLGFWGVIEQFRTFFSRANGPGSFQSGPYRVHESLRKKMALYQYILAVYYSIPPFITCMMSERNVL